MGSANDDGWDTLRWVRLITMGGKHTMGASNDDEWDLSWWVWLTRWDSIRRGPNTMVTPYNGKDSSGWAGFIIS
jgi:hypothetical protein